MSAQPKKDGKEYFEEAGVAKDLVSAFKGLKLKDSLDYRLDSLFKEGTLLYSIFKEKDPQNVINTISELVEDDKLKQKIINTFDEPGKDHTPAQFLGFIKSMLIENNKELQAIDLVVTKFNTLKALLENKGSDPTQITTMLSELDKDLLAKFSLNLAFRSLAESFFRDNPTHINADLREKLETTGFIKPVAAPSSSVESQYFQQLKRALENGVADWDAAYIKREVIDNFEDWIDDPTQNIRDANERKQLISMAAGRPITLATLKAIDHYHNTFITDPQAKQKLKQNLTNLLFENPLTEAVKPSEPVTRATTPKKRKTKNKPQESFNKRLKQSSSTAANRSILASAQALEKKFNQQTRENKWNNPQPVTPVTILPHAHPQTTTIEPKRNSASIDSKGLKVNKLVWESIKDTVRFYAAKKGHNTTVSENEIYIENTQTKVQRLNENICVTTEKTPPDITDLIALFKASTEKTGITQAEIEQYNSLPELSKLIIGLKDKPNSIKAIIDKKAYDALRKSTEPLCQQALEIYDEIHKGIKPR